MTPTDPAWAYAVAFLAAVVAIIAVLWCGWDLVWRIVDARTSSRPVTDDPQQEYAERAPGGVEAADGRRG